MHIYYLVLLLLLVCLFRFLKEMKEDSYHSFSLLHIQWWWG